MSNVRIVLNREGVRQLLKSDEVQADLERRGRAIAAAAGDGVEVISGESPTRARVTVRTATTDARIREATQRSLTRAFDAGR